MKVNKTFESVAGKVITDCKDKVELNNLHSFPCRSKVMVVEQIRRVAVSKQYFISEVTVFTCYPFQSFFHLELHTAANEPSKASGCHLQSFLRFRKYKNYSYTAVPSR